MSSSNPNLSDRMLTLTLPRHSFMKGDNPLSESWTDAYGNQHGGFFTATDEYTGAQVWKSVWPGINGTYAKSTVTGPGVKQKKENRKAAPSKSSDSLAEPCERYAT